MKAKILVKSKKDKKTELVATEIVRVYLEKDFNQAKQELEKSKTAKLIECEVYSKK